MIIGTCHFIGYAEAIRYYAKQGIDRDGVACKYVNGEICTNPPRCKDNEKLVILDDGLRYGIVEKNLRKGVDSLN